MKKSIITLSLMAMTLAANAQTSKNVNFDCVAKNMVYEEPVQKEQSTAGKVASVAGAVLSALAGDAKEVTNHPEYADNVMNAIKSGIGSARRFNTVDDATGNPKVLYINANIASITSTARTHTKTDKDKKTHTEQEFSALISGSVSLTDAATGKIVWEAKIKHGGLSYGWMPSAESALGDAVANLQSSITNSLNEEFPVYASIVEKGAVKNNKQKEVFIDLGEQAGVSKGTKFYVYQVETVAGKEAKKEIGQLKIKEVMGDDISVCKVTKGASDLKTAIDEGQTLQIMSRS